MMTSGIVKKTTSQAVPGSRKMPNASRLLRQLSTGLPVRSDQRAGGETTAGTPPGDARRPPLTPVASGRLYSRPRLVKQARRIAHVDQRFARGHDLGGGVDRRVGEILRRDELARGRVRGGVADV